MRFRDFIHIENVAALIAEDSRWKGKKPEILDSWKKLPPNLPLNIEPISSMQKGTRYRSDGIRITGNAMFINAVLTRLKEILPYENFKTDLDIRYEEIPKQNNPHNKKYVVYINVIDKRLVSYKKELEKQKRRNGI